MFTITSDISVEVRLANGSSMEFYQGDEERVRETLDLLAAPRLFAQPHLLLAWQHGASIIPCKGIDMIIARTSAKTPLKFPLNLPVGQFDIVEEPATWPEPQNEREPAQPHRRNSKVVVHTLGGWTVTLKAVAMIHGSVQDERHLFSHLPEVPTIPFRLDEGGFGLINTANIIRLSALPKPEALTGIALPLALLRWTPAARRGFQSDLNR